MEKATQVELAKTLMKGVTEAIIKNIEKYPLENWDGIEIRQYCSDYVRACTYPERLKGKRGKNYRNDVIINNM